MLASDKMTQNKSYLIQLFIIISLLYSCKNDKTSPMETDRVVDDYTYETSEDPHAPNVRDEWKNWIQVNHSRIESLDSDNFTDLYFLDEFINGKSLVLLGEVAHGIAEQNRLRVRIIKYLHQEHGFNVVAFESGLYDCYFTDRAFQGMNNTKVLENALYPFWNTMDLWNLIEYIRHSFSDLNPMHIAGFDFHSTGTMSLTRPQFFKDMTVKIDSSFSDTIFETDKIIVQRRTNRDYVNDYIVQNYEVVYALYQDLVDLITNNTDVLGQYYDEETLLVAGEVAVSVSQYILSRSVTQSYIIRDKRMAENVKFLKEVLYPGQKMIIWSHNGHIQKDLRSVAVLPGGYYYTGNNMGYWLHQHYGQEMYAIGSLAYRGHINYGLVQDINITADESIEAILYQARRKYFFIDLNRQTETEGNSWMFQPVTQSYIHRESPCDILYIPNDQYDGLFFIDTVSEPQYLY